MKHLLNNLSENEKNSIREQHEGGMTLDTSRFRTLLENKLGNAKPLVENEEDEDFGFASHSGDFDGDDSEEADYRMYDLPDVHQSIEDELEEMSDDEAIDYLKEIIEFCEDKLNGYDSEFEDEEEEEDLDLREFDDLEEDDTW